MILYFPYHSNRKYTNYPTFTSNNNTFSRITGQQSGISHATGRIPDKVTVPLPVVAYTLQDDLPNAVEPTQK